MSPTGPSGAISPANDGQEGWTETRSVEEPHRFFTTKLSNNSSWKKSEILEGIKALTGSLKEQAIHGNHKRGTNFEYYFQGLSTPFHLQEHSTTTRLDKTDLKVRSDL